MTTLRTVTSSPSMLSVRRVRGPARRRSRNADPFPSRVHSEEPREHRQVVPRLAGMEEIVAHVLSALGAQPPAHLRRAHRSGHLVRTSLDRAGEQPGALVNHLERYAAD